MKLQDHDRSDESRTTGLMEYDENFLNRVINVMKEGMAKYRKEVLYERSRRIALRTSASVEYVALEDIIRCEADGRYSKIILPDEDFLYVSMHMKELEAALHSNKFIRCHNSHLVNRDMVRRYNKSDGGFLEMSNGDQIPVARARKESVMNMMMDQPDGHSQP